MDDDYAPDEWTLEWLQTVNDKFEAMNEYQGQAVTFEGEEGLIWEELLEHWKYFILGYPMKDKPVE